MVKTKLTKAQKEKALQVTMAETRIPINECFLSIQGEGRNAGKLSIFLRTQGCNLKCPWCDTKDSWSDAQNVDVYTLSLNEIITEIERHSQCRHVVITGGEPMLHFEKMIPLFRELKKKDYTLEIETNGSYSLGHNDLFFSQVNVSYKITNREIAPYALKAIDRRYDYKFVIRSKSDVEAIEKLLEEQPYINRENIYLMPEGAVKEVQEMHMEEISRWAIEHGFNFSPRLHVLIWGGKRGV